MVVEPHVHREAVATEPDSPGAHYAMALALAAAGDAGGARRRLDEAIERVPDLRREALRDPLLSSLF